ncbi:hypothetical protein BDN72DRAFT_837494 [Pluteus cervinus]|uniref:Uncharacterized protein n=1 Tax=Pluteus cervinus TaxID=181527 RepID=A0ACD3B1W1_9AGAR|nr:hypothetical protein BDN72DRAFT_837494 [Pluteus cervinus]
MDTLAPELIEDIISWVYTESSPRDRSKTLAACCLVCRTWKHIAQHLLLSKFPVHGRDYDGPSFINTLISYPHLQKHVNSLWVQLDTWLKSTDKQSLLTQLLPNLQTIVIWFRFNEVGPREVDILSNIFSSDRLTRLGLVGSHKFPVSIFSQCSSLNELYLYKSSLYEARNQEFKQNTDSRPLLTQLHIESPYYEDIEAVRWFSSAQCSFDLSGLSSLHCIDRTKKNLAYDLVHTFVNLVSSSLQDLSLCPLPEFGHIARLHTYSSSTQFNPLPNLETLTLSLFQDYTTDTETIHLPWAIRLLSTLSHPQHLKVLRIPYHFRNWEAAKSSESEGHDIDYWEHLIRRQEVGWNNFEDLLTSDHFPNLCMVHFAAHDPDRGTELESTFAFGFAAVLPKLLPKLHDKGMLKLSFTSEMGYMSEKESWYYSR